MACTTSMVEREASQFLVTNKFLFELQIQHIIINKLICAARRRTTGATNADSELQTRFQVVIEEGDDWFKSPNSGTTSKLFVGDMLRATGDLNSTHKPTPTHYH